MGHHRVFCLVKMPQLEERVTEGELALACGLHIWVDTQAEGDWK